MSDKFDYSDIGTMSDKEVDDHLAEVYARNPACFAVLMVSDQLKWTKEQRTARALLVMHWRMVDLENSMRELIESQARPVIIYHNKEG